MRQSKEREWENLALWQNGSCPLAPSSGLTAPPVTLRALRIGRQEILLCTDTSGSTSAQKGHSLVLERSAGQRLTTRYGAVADAGHAVSEEALPARLLLAAVVDAAAAQLGRPVVALARACGVARAV